MLWQWTPYVTAEIVAAVILDILAFYFLLWSRKRRGNGAGALVLLVGAVCVLVHALEMGSTDFLTKDILSRIQLVCVVMLATTWLLFVLQNSWHDEWLTQRTQALLGIVPLVAFLLAVVPKTGNLSLLSEAIKDIGMLSCMAYAYALFLAGSFVLVQTLNRARCLRSREAKLLLFAVSLALLGPLLGAFDLGSSVQLGLELAPWALVVAGVIVVWTLPRLQLGDILPVAHEAIVEAMSDGVVVLDTEHRILELNPAARSLIGHSALEVHGQPPKQIWPDWPTYMKPSGDAEEAGGEVVLGQGDEQRIYDVGISPLVGIGSRVIGQVAVLHDVTERKRVEEELRKARDDLEIRVKERTAELTKANEKLHNEITERKQAEEALRMYGRIVSTTKDHLSFIDSNYVYKAVNEANCQAHNKLREDIVGHSTDELWGSEVHKKHIKGHLDQSLAGEEVHYQAWLDYPVLGHRCMDVAFYPFFDNDGTISGTVVNSHDITERKQVEEGLRRSEQRYRTVLEQMQDAYLETDLAGNITFFNDSLCRGLGFSREEMIGTNMWDYIPQEDRESGTKTFAKLYATRGQRITYPSRIIRRDGSIGFVETRASLVQNESGDIIGFRGVSRDITERKRAEEALQKSEEKHRELVESANATIYSLDAEGRFTYISPGIGSISQYKADELVGQPFTRIIHPDDIPDLLSAWERAIASGEDVAGEYRWVDKDGSERYAHVFPKMQFRDSQLVAMSGVIVDITERRQVEAALGAEKELTDRILAATPNGVAVIDQDLRIILANSTFHDMFKMKTGQVKNRQFNEVIAAKGLLEAISKVLQGKEPQVYLEFRHKVTGHDRLMVANVTPMREGEILVLLRDITDERERQQRLYLTDRLASVGEMASGIAHELNNPLTTVIGFSQLLMEEEFPDDIEEDIAAINSQAQRAASIVKNLLSFARKSEPVMQPTQINSVIDDLLNLRAYEQRVHNIDVDTRLAPQLPEVMVDHHEMQQVFLNIILNAESAMAEGHNHHTLKITTERVDNVVRASFTDCGPGIAKENLSRVFDPFFTTKEVGKGTGLGLSICHGIVTKHGGSIYARSKLGKGATFVVELPVNST